MSEDYFDKYAEDLIDYLETSQRFKQLVKKLAKQPAQKSARFKAPTKEEVFSYAKQKDRLELADKFWSHFTETQPQWTDSKGTKVRNWKQKFLTWTRNNPKKESDRERFSI